MQCQKPCKCVVGHKKTIFSSTAFRKYVAPPTGEFVNTLVHLGGYEDVIESEYVLVYEQINSLSL